MVPVLPDPILDKTAETAQQRGCVRRWLHACDQGLRIQPLPDQIRRLYFQVGTHNGVRELRMELHAPGAGANSEGLVRLEPVTPQQHRAFRQAQYGLPMRQLCRECLWEVAEQDIGGGFWEKFNLVGASFPAI